MDKKQLLSLMSEHDKSALLEHLMTDCTFEVKNHNGSNQIFLVLSRYGKIISLFPISENSREISDWFNQAEAKQDV